MKTKMHRYSRIITLVASLALVGVIFLPLWSIEMTAPQYPEGLKLKIYSNKLGGNVEVVNGLNHYIGMRTLHEKDFPEFIVLPYIIAALVFFGALSFLLNRRWFFLVWAAFYMIFSVTAMLDFYRWEYNYGHNLDPSAPIQVPGMSYQPPLIGFKQLLNFGVYSMPDVGGLLFIAVALSLLTGVYLEWKSYRRSTLQAGKISMVAAHCAVSFFFAGCQAGPVPIHYGQDACTFCKMTISDRHFGAEVISQKGKAYLFDDTHCLRQFLQAGSLLEKEVKEIYLVDYSQSGQLIPLRSCFLIKSEQMHSPMGGNMAAFATADSMEKYSGIFKAGSVKWTDPYSRAQ